MNIWELSDEEFQALLELLERPTIEAWLVSLNKTKGVK